MTWDGFVALSLLAMVASFTPGPNNALVAASAVNFGIRKTLPHILGISIGFSLMIFLVGLALGALFEQSVLLRETLRWIGIVLLIYVAYKIATSGGLGSSKSEPRPFTFLEAAGFQWINPKGWSMSVAVTAQFASGSQPVFAALVVSFVFGVLALASTLSWGLLGQGIRRFLTNDVRLKWFNWTMAILILACIFLVLD